MEPVNADRAKRLGALVVSWLTVLSGAAAHADEAPVTKLTILHQFDLSDGGFPGTKLIEVEDGVFYGTTSTGGAKDGGTLFKITAGGELTTLYSFGLNQTAFEGSSPSSDLVLGPNGDLYGTTSMGGTLAPDIAGGAGTLFRINKQGELTLLHTFVGSDGSQPFGALLLAADGNFYGTTYSGGSRGGGNVFKLTPSGQISELYSFPASGEEGALLSTPVVQGKDGALYGTARDGGANFGGTVFRLTLEGAFTLLHSFPYSDGPGSVAFGADGALYGTTSIGGTAYRITTDGLYTTLHQFPCSCGMPEGSQPTGVLTLASNGNFYGVASHGGTHNNGAIYSMTHEGVVTPLHSFADAESNGPSGGIIEGRDGRFYGTTFGLFEPRMGIVYKLAFRPKPPENLVAATNADRVTLNWSASKSANSYDVFESTVSGAQGATPILSGITATTANVTGLSKGVTHYFKVAATNEAGSSDSSNEVTALIVAMPDPPAAEKPTTPQNPLPSNSSSGGGGVIDWMLLAMLSLFFALRCTVVSPALQKVAIPSYQ